MMPSIAGMLGAMGTSLLDGATDFGGQFLDGVTGAVGNKVGTAGLASVGPQANAVTQPQTIGINSTQQGSNVPSPGVNQPVESTGQQAGKLVVDTAKDIVTGVSSQASSQLANDLVQAAFGDNKIAQAKLAGKASRGYLDAAFPEANVWDKLGQSGSAASGVGGAMSQNTAATGATRQFGQQLLTQNNELNNQLKIAGINSATSRMNTLDTLRVNEKSVDSQIMLAREQQKVQEETQKLLGQQTLTQRAQQQLLGAQTSETSARESRTRTLTPAELDSIKAGTARQEKPGRIGELITTGQTVGKELKSFADKMAPKSTGKSGPTLEDLKAYYNGETSINRDGIGGATSRK